MSGERQSTEKDVLDRHVFMEAAGGYIECSRGWPTREQYESGEHEAANERARDEYRTHPMASSCGSSCRCSWRMGKQARQKAQEAAGRAARGQVAPENVRAAKGAQIGAQQLSEGTDG